MLLNERVWVIVMMQVEHLTLFVKLLEIVFLLRELVLTLLGIARYVTVNASRCMLRILI